VLEQRLGFGFENQDRELSAGNQEWKTLNAAITRIGW
jgi:hypothetical protein